MGSIEETKPGDPIFRLMERIECRECLDTGISITLYGPSHCVDCTGKKRMWSNPAFQLQRCVFARVAKQQPIDTQALSLARALTHFTPAAALLLKQIVNYWCVDIRQAKALVATLRGEWLLPIGSLRQPPYGAYWITTAEDFLEWSRAYRSQAITSLVTVYKLQRQHFPHLYGQEDFGFVKQIADELQEAL